MQVQYLGREDSPGERHGNPLQYSCLENSMDRRAWCATVHGVTKSWTRLSDKHTGIEARLWQPVHTLLFPLAPAAHLRSVPPVPWDRASQQRPTQFLKRCPPVC